MLKKDKLTNDEEPSVKNAARHLLKRLYEEKPKVLTPDWYKFAQTQATVKNTIEEVLDKDLPESYDRQVYSQKCNKVYQIILRRSVEGAA